MQTDIVLQRLNTARDALAEAKTIQETKRIVDIAAAAEILAKRQKLGEEAIQYATSIKVEALAQLGRMLKETPKNRGTRLIGGSEKYSGGSKVEPPDDLPTLAEMGLDKKTSKLAQDIASLPDEQLEAVKMGVVALSKAQKIIKEQKRIDERRKMAEKASSVLLSEKWTVIHADMTTVKLNKQFDFIITDPPYPKEYLHLWRELGRRAAEWLKDGGLLIAMSGQSYVNDIYKMLDEFLDYYWTASYLTPGQPTPLRQVNVNSTWKPLLIYSKGKYTGKIFGDVFVSDGNDKSLHKWGQSESGMLSIIKGICLPGQSILDPFCGAGTTLVAGLQHNCYVTGIDIDEQNIKITKGRLAEL